MNILLKCLTITLTLVAGLQAMDDKCPEEIKHKILTEVVKDNYVDLCFTNFIESVRPLRTVCKQWGNIISHDFMHDAMVLGCQQICPEFLNGKLIYWPKGASDVGIIEFKISDLWNPLGGKFPLSQCKILDKKDIGLLTPKPRNFRTSIKQVFKGLFCHSFLRNQNIQHQQ